MNLFQKRIVLPGVSGDRHQRVEDAHRVLFSCLFRIVSTHHRTECCSIQSRSNYGAQRVRCSMHNLYGPESPRSMDPSSCSQDVRLCSFIKNAILRIVYSSRLSSSVWSWPKFWSSRTWFQPACQEHHGTSHSIAMGIRRSVRHPNVYFL